MTIATHTICVCGHPLADHRLREAESERGLPQQPCARYDCGCTDWNFDPSIPAAQAVETVAIDLGPGQTALPPQLASLINGKAKSKIAAEAKNKVIVSQQGMYGGPKAIASLQEKTISPRDLKGPAMPIEELLARHGIVAPDSQPADSSAVDHPPHYGGKDNPFEAIKVIEAWKLDFHVGNAVKYLSRAGKKDPTKEIEDLEKAIWYIRRRIGLLGAK
jgi:hypothetical protein